jgi:hypothetical protein
VRQESSDAEAEVAIDENINSAPSSGRCATFLNPMAQIENQQHKS